MQLRYVLLGLIFLNAAQATPLENLVAATDIKGGVAVFVNPSDPELLVKLGESRAFLVQAVHTDADQSAKVRQTLKATENYGRLTARPFDGERLPYLNNGVNLLVIEDAPRVSDAEIRRALTPRGVALIRNTTGWKTLRKAVPADIDDWTHALYDPTNSVASDDGKVGPPRRLQWLAGPGWSRSHEHMISFNAMVSEGGIVYYVVDLGSRSSIALPARWTLFARDAFNGKTLWRKQLPSWTNHLWPLKTGPTQIQRRLVAVDGKVYIPLGATVAVSVIDGKTGEVIRTLEGSDKCEEILVTRNTVLVQSSDQVVERQGYRHEISAVWHAGGAAKKDFKWDPRKRDVIAYDAATGEKRWHYQTPCVPMTISATGDAVYFFDGLSIQSVGLIDGKPRWKSDPVVSPEYGRKYELGTAFAPTMLVYGGAILFTGQEHKTGNVMTGVDLKSGKILWRKPYHESGHHSQEDIIPMNGLIWTGGIGRIRHQGGTYTGLDPMTGEAKREFECNVDPNYWFHQRCYRSKATKNFILAAATGIEYIDPKSGEWNINHWVRGGCLYGIMPANGITYVPPNPCACYSETQIRALSAFAPDPENNGKVAIQTDNRLVKGPAFTRSLTAATKAGDWPVYRRDNRRTGASDSTVGSNLKKKWTLKLNSDITPPVAAGGMVYIAEKELHHVHAISQATGEKLWTYTTAGRIDSPPALWKGRVIFGCSDGWVYSLDANDGELAWRFRAAPQDRQMLAHEQLESVWPVHGSVLVEHDRVYALAGRSMFVDGGMYMSVLDAATGHLINSEIYDDVDPINGKSTQIRSNGSKLPASRPDILSATGDGIFLMSQKIDKDGKRMWPTNKGQKPGQNGLTRNNEDQDQDRHLFSISGFLDDSWFHRTYWMYGAASGSGWGTWMKPMRLVPSGRIMAIGKDNVYGYGRKPVFYRQSSVTEYQIYSVKQGQFSRDKAAELRRPVKVVMTPEQKEKFESLRVAAVEAGRKYGKNSPQYLAANEKFVSFREHINQLPVNKKLKEEWRANNPDVADWKKSARFPDSKHTLLRYNWQQKDPEIMVRAMVLAGDTLLAAGPPDLLDEEKLYGRFKAKETQPELQRQQAAWNGELGGLLWLINTADGKRITSIDLSAPPVFDGMAVAGDQVIIAQQDKTLTCYGK